MAFVFRLVQFTALVVLFSLVERFSFRYFGNRTYVAHVTDALEIIKIADILTVL